MDCAALRQGLSEGPRVAVGIGGTSRNFIESAAVVFSEPGQALHVYGIMLQIVRPEQDLMDLPSLLGRDILNNWRMHYSPPTNRLAFEVVTADRTVPLSD